MAEVVAISLQVDSGNSVNEVKKLEDAIKDVQKTTNSSNVEEKFNSLNQAIDRGEGSVEDLRKAIKSYQTIALSAGRTSPIGQEALKRSAQLKDKLTDLDNEVKRLAQDGKNLQGAMQIGQSVMAGYSAFIGISALAGEGNEELQKTMVKLTATMSIMQGIEQIRLATEKESQAMMLIKETKLKVVTALQKAYAFAVGTGTKAMKLFRLALISTGIGALVVLIGVIISKWDDWKDTVLNFIKGALSPLIDALKWLGIMESDLEKQRRTNHENEMKRIQERRDSLNSVRDKVEQDLKNEIAIAKARGENTDKSQKKLLKLTRDNAQERIDDNNALIEEIESGNRKATEEEYKNIQDSIIADRKLREGAEQDLKVFDETKSRERREAGKKASDKITAEQQKRDEEELQMLRDKMQKELDLEQEMQDLIIENMQDEDAKKLAQLQLQHERELADLTDKYGMETELEIELLKKQARELNEAKKEIAEESKNEMDEMANFFEQQDEERREKQVLKNIEATTTELANLKATEEQKENIRIAGFKTAESITNSLGVLMEGNEKAQKGVLAVQKAMTLAQIGIDTAKAISSLTAMSAGNPANAVTGGVAGVLQYASGIATILSNVAQAKKLLSGSGSVSVSSGSGVTAPSFATPSTDTSTINSQSTNGDASGFNTATNRVVLVESDLRMMQERRNNSDIISTI